MRGATNIFFRVVPAKISMKIFVAQPVKSRPLHAMGSNVSRCRLSNMIDHLPDFIKKNVSLADKNWFKTGGPAQFFAMPTDGKEFKEALLIAQNAELPLFVLGTGANVLIADHGFPGLVIRPALQHISIECGDSDAMLVTAGAGVNFATLIQHCLDQQLIGLEEFSGIPSTVGGAVYINLHYFEFLIDQFLVRARVMSRVTGEITSVDADWFEFAYDDSRLHRKDYFLFDATFRVKKVSELEIAYARGRVSEIIRHRQRRYPSQNTCGSFFRNFLPDEISLTVNGKKAVWAAYYLDQVGVKGSLICGGALVSPQHANMIVNTGSATSSDIISCAQIMQRRVFEKFGVCLQPECQLVGFDNDPLAAIKE
jgi:UDP-N-acetylmuramate dehydrogenase